MDLQESFLKLYSEDDGKFSESFRTLANSINKFHERQKEVFEAMSLNSFHRTAQCPCHLCPISLCPCLRNDGSNIKLHGCPCETGRCSEKGAKCPCKTVEPSCLEPLKVQEVIDEPVPVRDGPDVQNCPGRTDLAKAHGEIISKLMIEHFEIWMNIFHKHAKSGNSGYRRFIRDILRNFLEKCKDDDDKRKLVDGFLGLITDGENELMMNEQEKNLFDETEKRELLFNKGSLKLLPPKSRPTDLDLALLTQCYMGKLLDLKVHHRFIFDNKNKAQMKRFEKLIARGNEDEKSAVQFCIIIKRMQWQFQNNLGGSGSDVQQFGEEVINYFNDSTRCKQNESLKGLMSLMVWGNCVEAWKEFKEKNRSVGIAVTVEGTDGHEVILIQEKSGQRFWSFPKGQQEFTDLGLKDTASREIFEEVGLKLDEENKKEVSNLKYVGVSGKVTLFRHALTKKPEYLNRPDGVEIEAIE